MQMGGWEIWEENTDIYPWYQNFFCALIQFLNARQDFGEKIKDNQLSNPAQNLTSQLRPSHP